MSVDIADPGHGNSIAAWTAVAIMLVGVLTGTVAFFLVGNGMVGLTWLVWASVGIVLAGLLVGLILYLLGYGVRGAKTLQKKAH